MKQLYEIQAVYTGRDLKRTGYSTRCVTAERDDAAIEFARFIFNDWSESTITVSRYRAVHIPAGYRQGDPLDDVASSLVIEEWDQP